MKETHYLSFSVTLEKPSKNFLTRTETARKSLWYIQNTF